MVKKIVFYLVVTLNSFYFFGQTNCSKVLLHGKVIDSLSPQTFYNSMIVNRTNGKGVFGQPNGTFSLYVNNNDSINISVKGYYIIGFRIKADNNCQFMLKEYIERIPTEIQEVLIYPLKSLEQIKEERSSLALRETRMVTGIDALKSPITALYQAFSQREQNKRWIAEQTFKDDQRKVVKELLRLYVAYDIINLSEEQFDDFIAFLNIDDDFFKTATEMELVTFIKDKFEHYSRVNNISYAENNRWREELANNNKKSALFELLNIYVSHDVIKLPPTEFDKFINFMNVDATFLRSATEAQLLSFIQSKYVNYIEINKLDFDNFKKEYYVTNDDNSIWKSELNCIDNEKPAIKELLRLYNRKEIIQLQEAEFDRFIMFMNIEKKLLINGQDKDIIRFVQDKYYRYIKFYKVKP